MVLNVHKNNNIRLIRDGDNGGGGGGGGDGVRRWMVGEVDYLPYHCYHQNDSCIKMGSNKVILMFH